MSSLRQPTQVMTTIWPQFQSPLDADSSVCGNLDNKTAVQPQGLSRVIGSTQF